LPQVDNYSAQRRITKTYYKRIFMKKKYQRPHIYHTLIKCEDLFAAASVTVQPGGNDGFPSIVEEEIQTSEKDWIFNAE